MNTLTRRASAHGNRRLGPNERELVRILEPIAREYPDLPPGWVSTMSQAEPVMLQRIAYDMSIVINRKGTDLTVVDVGAGTGLWNLGFAALGARSIFVDAFFENPYKEEFLRLFDRHGVEVIERDVSRDGLTLPKGSVDVVANFHFMEHLHHSPKRLFHSLVDSLKPGGLFVLAGPNCVNIRKRVTGLIGKCKWSSMEHWYEADTFYGHVREPDVDDFRYIANDLGLDSYDIYGRNFLGLSHRGLKRGLAQAADIPLRRRPNLCSDIYLVASHS